MLEASASSANLPRGTLDGTWRCLFSRVNETMLLQSMFGRGIKLLFFHTAKVRACGGPGFDYSGVLYQQGISHCQRQTPGR